MARLRLGSTVLATTLPLALGSMLLVACSSDDDESSAPTAPTATTAVSTGPTVTMAPTDTADLPPITPLDTSDLPPITPLDTSDLPAATGPAGSNVIEGCPVGDWYASQQEMQAFYDTIGARAAVSFLFEGDAELQLRGDGTLSYVLEDFLLKQEAGGTHVDVRLTGSVDGVYTASGSVLRTTNVEPNVTAEAFVDDTPMDATTVLQSFLAQFPFNEATYQCSGDDLVMDVPVLGTTHTLTLVPVAG